MLTIQTERTALLQMPTHFEARLFLLIKMKIKAIQSFHLQFKIETIKILQHLGHPSAKMLLKNLWKAKFNKKMIGSTITIISSSPNNKSSLTETSTITRIMIDSMPAGLTITGIRPRERCSKIRRVLGPNWNGPSDCPTKTKKISPEMTLLQLRDRAWINSIIQCSKNQIQCKSKNMNLQNFQQTKTQSPNTSAQ